MIYNDHFFKLELLILAILKQQDYSWEQISMMISDYSKHYVEIKFGTLLVSLYYMKNAKLISEYCQDNDFFFHIENAGLVRFDTLKRQYLDIVQSIDAILKERNYE